MSLTRAQARTQGNTPAVAPITALTPVPDLTLPQALSAIHASSGAGGGGGGGGGASSGADGGGAGSGPHAPPHGRPHPPGDEEYRIIKTCFSVTIRRDRYEIPVAIMGQWIPIL